MRATPITSPFLAVPSRTSASVAGFMRIVPRDGHAMVTALPATSTMCARPAGSKCVSASPGDARGSGHGGAPVPTMIATRLSWISGVARRSLSRCMAALLAGALAFAPRSPARRSTTCPGSAARRPTSCRRPPSAASASRSCADAPSRLDPRRRRDHRLPEPLRGPADRDDAGGRLRLRVLPGSRRHAQRVALPAATSACTPG